LLKAPIVSYSDATHARPFVQLVLREREKLDASKNLPWFGSGDHDSMVVVRDGGVGCGGKPGSSTSMSV
jgi:hypothetical protein